jgi:hypothetical protein
MRSTVEKVESVLRTTKGILDVKWIDQEAIKNILELEEEVRQKGLSVSGGYYNEGTIEVLVRKYVCVALNNTEFRHATVPSLFWMVGDVVIGEEVIDADRLQDLVKKNTVKVLRKNFILHFDRMKASRGQAPVFVIRGLPFPEIGGIAGLRDVLSASPIGSADVYLKQQYGWDTNDRSLGTILIGFNIKN